MGKDHRRKPVLSRDVAPKQEIKKRILIVSEGINTEPSYFQQFRVPGTDVKTIGKGEGTRKLVGEVERVLKEETRKSGFAFDEIWVAFDKDDFTDFNIAIQEAKNKGYHVAYSNQAIEYWFILHFVDHQGGGLDRKNYAKILNQHLEPFGVHYDPDSKVISEDMFNLMYKRLPIALDRGNNIYQSKLTRKVPTEESVTTVFKLVKSITGMRSLKEQTDLLMKQASMKKAGIIK